MDTEPRSLTKQEARLLKKKRKLGALAQLSKLNEEDRESGRLRKASTAESEGSVDAEPEEKRTKVQDDDPENGEKSTTLELQNVILSPEDYVKIKRELNQKRRELRNIPKIRLKLFGENASLAVDPSIRTPLFLTDIQHLIMYTVLGSAAPCVPSRWCTLEKVNKLSHTTVLMVDGLSLFHYSSYESLFEKSRKIFENQVEVVMPLENTGDKVLNELITVPLTNEQKTELIEKYGSLEAALDSMKNPMLLVKTVFPVIPSEEWTSADEQDSADDVAVVHRDAFPRTQLLLSALQMVDEGYPLPLRGELANRYKDFVLTKESYKDVTGSSPMYGLDCEMCRTSAGLNELTRISIINENEESVYETLVCPQNKIVDYLTRYSGITPEMMKNVTKTLAQVQEDVRQMLPPDAILVGQSLQSDLMAMRMMHPYVIDTSIIFNLSGDRRRKSKLQTLASEFLGENIQKNPLGHDSIEDCSASLKLTKLKLKKGIDFGDAILINRRRFHDKCKEIGTNSDKSGVNNTTCQTTTSKSTNQKDRSTAVITSCEANSTSYQSLINNKALTNAQTNTTEDHTEQGDLSDSPKTTATQSNIRLYQNSSNRAAIENTCHLAINHALTLTHLNLTEKCLKDTKIEKTIQKVDQWIADIWQSIAPHGLFIVVFGASVPNSASGVALLQVK